MPDHEKLSEREMEDLVLEHSDELLEPGLELIQRQFAIGAYRFDLLFRDRRGAHMIVELQVGKLDRSHTYKILDYYEEYKFQHPDEYVELMVVATEIPVERKRRLTDHGIEHKEISLAEFLRLRGQKLAASQAPYDEAPDVHDPAREIENASPDPEIRSLNRLFVEQTCDFRDRVRRDDPQARFRMANSLPDDGQNWFITWYPGSWKRPSSNAGVHWALTCPRRGSKPSRFLRMALGAESPLRDEHKVAFKERVAADVRRLGRDLGFQIFPDTPRGAKLASGTEFSLDLESGRRALEIYRSASPLNDIVAEALERFDREGWFDRPLR